MTSEQRLYTKLSELSRAKHTSYPEHLTMPKRTYNLKTANGLTQAVKVWIQAHGYQAERVSTTGRMIDERKEVTDSVGFTRTIGSIGYIPGTGTKGSADIHATIPLNGSNGFGVSVKIEIKIGSDKMSEHQKHYAEQVKTANGVYIVVKTLDDLMQWWDANVMNTGSLK